MGHSVSVASVAAIAKSMVIHIVLVANDGHIVQYTEALLYAHVEFGDIFAYTTEATAYVGAASDASCVKNACFADGAYAKSTKSAWTSAKSAISPARLSWTSRELTMAASMQK